MMNENFLSCGIFDWLSIAMLSGTGFLAMLVLLSLLMTLGRYILEGRADGFVHGGRSLDSSRQCPTDAVRNHRDDTGVRSAIPIRDEPQCSSTSFEVPNPKG